MKRTLAVSCSIVLALSACSTKRTTTNGKAPNTHPRASATLEHMPRGSVTISWSPSTHTLSVSGRLEGLAPNSIHPTHIHQGSCASQGPPVYPLPVVHADATGDATITGSFQNVKEGIPATGWYINVHTGPGKATPAESRQIACVDITNSTPAMTLPHKFSAPFAAPPGAGNNVTGQASLTFDTTIKTLKVRLSLSGLEPNSTHAAHVHRGSCAAQGPVAYPLQTVTADANGTADVTTTVKDVTQANETLYVNVHNSTDLGSQIGFTPVACGDVKSS